MLKVFLVMLSYTFVIGICYFTISHICSFLPYTLKSEQKESEMLRKFMPILLIIVLLDGCVGIGIYEDPKILDKDESRLGVGIPFALIRNGVLFIPLPEIYYRRGIAKNQEFLIRAPLAFITGEDFAFSFGGKYRFGNRRVITSLGFNTFITSDENFNVVSAGIYYRLLSNSLIGIQALTSLKNPDLIYRFYVGNRSKWKSIYVYNGLQLVLIESDFIGVLQTGIEIPLGQKSNTINIRFK